MPGRGSDKWGQQRGQVELGGEKVLVHKLESVVGSHLGCVLFFLP